MQPSTAATNEVRAASPCPCWLVVLQGSRHQQMIQEEELRRVDLRRRMRATVVPTSDGEVRRLLRQLGEPVTLFGEQQVRGSCGMLGLRLPQQHGMRTQSASLRRSGKLSRDCSVMDASSWPWW